MDSRQAVGVDYLFAHHGFELFVNFALNAHVVCAESGAKLKNVEQDVLKSVFLPLFELTENHIFTLGAVVLLGHVANDGAVGQ